MPHELETGGNAMARCEVCGNDYDMTFEVHAQGGVHVFDCFECAITRLAPICERCGCRIVGHGVEFNGRWYCCAHCARESGAKMIADKEVTAGVR